jgi:lipid A ethanolaminephosphotransferase
MLTAIVVLYLLVFENAVFWRSMLDILDVGSPQGLLTLAAWFVFVVGLWSLALMPLSFPPVQRPLLSVLILVAAAVGYFQVSYGTIIDEAMIRNIAETDMREATELLTPGYLGHLLLHGLLPIAVLWLVPVRRGRWTRELRALATWSLAIVVVVGAVAWLGYKDLSLVAREHRELRMKLNPSYPLYAAVKYLRGHEPAAPVDLQPVAGDSHKPADDTDPHLVVLVLGETARSANFSLAGYPRPTNPRLAQEDILFYPDVSACGTATAASVPCLFAHLGRAEFDVDKARAYENVLDILQGTGVAVTWIDNNTGCKGVCDRVESVDVAFDTDPELCATGECFDAILLRYLDRLLAQPLSGDRLIVLHQKGSHGPAYFKRHPADFARFQPECASAAPQDCPRDEIVNAYDNTILYTDYILAEIIGRLQRYPAAEKSMVYVSDHGESLGEGGIYLHGLPYFLAPDEQVHVPMVLWMSPAFVEDEGIDRDCLEAQQARRQSHDELFHTLLRLFEVDSSVYDPRLDLIGRCIGVGRE